MDRGEPLTLRAGGVERPLCDIAGLVRSIVQNFSSGVFVDRKL